MKAFLRRHADRLIALGLFLATTAVTCAASTRQGVHRDEAVYMEAGEKYITYWERLLGGELPRPFSRATIDRYWSGLENNSEHPPLMKTLYGLSWRLFHRCECAAEAAWHPGIARLGPDARHRTIPILSEITAFRLPTMALFGLLAALVYLFSLEAFRSRAGALLAALLTVAQPRAFFHAQTAAFDLPAAVMWFATSYAWWRALGNDRHPYRAAAFVGVLYGLFLATKLQSFFLPFALLAHFGWLAVSRWRRGEKLPRPWPLVAMATIGPLVLVLLWPYLWHDTWARFRAYTGFHAKHVNYNFEYFGVNYNHPPFPKLEPLGMLVTTAPVILLALAAVGAILYARAELAARRGEAERDGRATWLLVGLGVLVPVSPFFLGTTPIFGETKHWLATMPYLAILAGLAVQAIAARVAEEWRLSARARAAAAAAIVAACALPAVVETARSHPYGLSHYNALAGGAPGGADLGMNRQFWGYSVRGLLPWLNRLPAGARIYPHDWNHAAYLMYLRDGLLRKDLVETGLELPAIQRSDVALVIHELHFNKYEYMIWNSYQTAQPAEVLTLDGVPLVTVYRRGAK